MLSILLNLGKWRNSLPTKCEVGCHAGRVLEALIGVGMGKPALVLGAGPRGRGTGRKILQDTESQQQ